MRTKHVTRAVEPTLQRGFHMLGYLSHQREANGKFIDVLAVDADGVLTVIELKIGQDDEMLFQALEYYDHVSANRDRLAAEYAKKASIVTAEDPRIILT